MVKKPSMQSLIDKLNDENAYEILSNLKDLYNSEGKNAVLAALDQKRYNKVRIMLSPVKKPDKEEYVLFFNPFKNAVVSGNEPLRWPSIPAKMQYLGDYTGYLNTKDTFYDFYSVYSYIECMEEGKVKRFLEELATNIPTELFDKIYLTDLPAAISNREATVYSEEDIVKYYPLPYISFVQDLYNKGIDAKSEFENDRFGSIIINLASLSPQNKVVARSLMNSGIASEQNGQLIIGMRLNSNIRVSDIKEYLERLSVLFKEQKPKYQKIDIDQYYNFVRVILSRVGVKLPSDPDQDEKIMYCKKYNQKLTLSEDHSFFYIHPGVKERIEQANGIKL